MVHSFQTSFILTLLMSNYCMIVLFFPIMLQHHTHQPDDHLDMPRPFSCTSSLPKVSSKSVNLTNLRSGRSTVLLTWFPDAWDPGPGSSRGCSPYLSRTERNKLAHSRYGNRGKRGKGITCIYWNKGPSHLINKHQDIETVIADHHPHILGLGEANHGHHHDIDAVQFPGYTLHLDSGIDNAETGRMSRVAVYTHSSIRVKRRHDLQDDMTAAALWLECGLPGQKGFLVCVGYRQWRLLGQEDDSSASVTEQLVRWTKFIDMWETALSEGKEVMVMMDANLDFLTWRNCDNLPKHHSSNKLKSLIDAVFSRIMPLGVSQLVTVATRMERGQPRTGLDHLYSNRPDKLSSVQTYYTGMSDHKLLKVQRFTKSFQQFQRYVRKRSFKHFDEGQFKQKLNNIKLDEVLECTDVNIATEMLTQKLTTILDDLAPIRTFQTRTQYAPWLSEETKSLKKQREEAHEKAVITDAPDDWRYSQIKK